MEELNTAGIEATEAAGVVSESFTPEELETMQEWGEADGWLIDEQAAAAERSKDTVQDAFGGSISPSGYDFPAPPASLEPLDLAEQQAIRTAMAEAGIPRDVGNEMARRWNTALMKPQDESALQIGMKQAEAQLRQTYGTDADEIIRLARSEAARIAKRVPGVQTMIEQTQLGNDVWLTATLANIARARKQSY